MKHLYFLFLLLVTGAFSVKAQDYSPLKPGIHPLFNGPNGDIHELWIEQVSVNGSDSIFTFGNSVGKYYNNQPICLNVNNGRIAGTHFIKKNGCEYIFVNSAQDSFLLNLCQPVATSAIWNNKKPGIQLLNNGVQWRSLARLQDSVMEFEITGLAAIVNPVIWISKQYGIWKMPDLELGDSLYLSSTKSQELNSTRDQIESRIFKSGIYEERFPGDTLVVREHIRNWPQNTEEDNYSFTYYTDRDTLSANVFVFSYHHIAVRWPGPLNNMTLQSVVEKDWKDTVTILDTAIIDHFLYVDMAYGGFYVYSIYPSPSRSYLAPLLSNAGICYSWMPDLFEGYTSYPYAGSGYKNYLSVGGTQTDKDLIYQRHEGSTRGQFPDMSIILGRGKINAQQALISPNPVSNLLTIQAAINIEHIQLLGNDGRLLQEWNNNGNSFNADLSQFATGIYFIRVDTGEGSSIQKLIKQ